MEENACICRFGKGYGSDDVLCTKDNGYFDKDVKIHLLGRKDKLNGKSLWQYSI